MAKEKEKNTDNDKEKALSQAFKNIEKNMVRVLL